MGLTTNYSESEYLLFLLIYASHVDFNFSTEERLSLQKSFPKIFMSVENKFTQLEEGERIVYLTDGLLNPEIYEKVECFEALMQEHFLIDGKFCAFERSFLEFYQQLRAAV